MPEREKVAATPWQVPVALDDVPEEGCRAAVGRAERNRIVQALTALARQQPQQTD